mgnify:FL=1|tara:strand:+ start:408 stop:668 length:261 start_codon:yes stop_codon:yes gene_type:complete
MEGLSFPEWLAIQLVRLRWTKTEAAIAFRVSRQTLHRWETGESVPTVGALVTIAGVISKHTGATVSEVWDQLLDIFIEQTQTAITI